MVKLLHPCVSAVNRWYGKHDHENITKKVTEKSEEYMEENVNIT